MTAPTMRQRTAIPPTTPPTMAPTGVELPPGAGVAEVVEELEALAELADEAELPVTALEREVGRTLVLVTPVLEVPPIPELV